jgi:hypothetical protein
MQMTRFCAIEVIGEPCQRSIGLQWDILVIAVFSLVIYYWAQAVRPLAGEAKETSACKP